MYLKEMQAAGVKDFAFVVPVSEPRLSVQALGDCLS